MSDTAIDPADLSMREEDARKDGRRRFKKLAKGAPGDIRLVNKQGILSQGTRAVQFENTEWPVGLDEQEEADFEKELIEVAAEEDDPDNDGTAEWAVAGLSAVEQLNLYFAHRANRTLAEIYPSADGTSILCFIDVFLDGEALDDFQEHSEELTRMLADKQRVRAEGEGGGRGGEARGRGAGQGGPRTGPQGSRAQRHREGARGGREAEGDPQGGEPAGPEAWGERLGRRCLVTRTRPSVRPLPVCQ